MQAYVDTFIQALEGYSVDFFLALAVLVGGWIIAFAISVICRKILERFQLDKHISHISGGSEKSDFHFARHGKTGAHWTKMPIIQNWQLSSANIKIH